MAKSLQDQLLKGGLVDNRRAKKAKSDKRKQTRMQRKNKVEVVDESGAQLQKRQAEKTERDRQLNRQRKEQAEHKEVDAQIRQLIELNRQAKDEEGTAFNFQDNNKVKRIYVNESMREQIIKGSLVIVKLDGQYEIVPSEVAGKIRGRDEGRVVELGNQSNKDVTEDDPYSDYQVPDDLIW